MAIENIMAELDREIARLQEARALLSGSNGHALANGVGIKRKPGRPKGSGKLSPQGRRRIAEAMRRSWAERKKRAASVSSSSKKSIKRTPAAK